MKFETTFDQIVDRIGRTPKKRLAWIVDSMRPNRRPKTGGDWDNLRLEIAGFAGIGTSGLDGSDSEGITEIPSRQEALNIVAELATIIETIIARKPIDVDISQEETIRGLRWHRGKFYIRRDFAQDWRSRSVITLLRLAADYGHLVKRCDAPKPWQSAACGNWFVADRPNKKYCSPQCQTRTTTRKNPPKKKQSKGKRKIKPK